MSSKSYSRFGLRAGMVLALLGLCPTMQARAQDVAPDAGVAPEQVASPPAPSTAAPSAAPTPTEPVPAAATPTPAVPVSTLVPADPGPTPAAESAPTSQASSPKERDTRGIVIGADLGLASGGGGSELFGAGFGSSLSFGYRSGSYELILRLAESYDLRPDPVLKGALDGSFKPSSVVFSYWLSLYGDWRLGLGGGPAMVSSSFVTTEAGTVGVVDRDGVGAALMVGAKLPIGEAANFVVSLHGYALFWEHPAKMVIQEVEDDMIVRTIDPSDGTPVSLSAGFHFQF